jgi:hypothetical protein
MYTGEFILKVGAEDRISNWRQAIVRFIIEFESRLDGLI